MTAPVLFQAVTQRRRRVYQPFASYNKHKGEKTAGNFLKKNLKKVLDIGVKLWYSNQARSRERGERTNLENDTEKKRAKERDSEDSKELKTRKRLKRIKRKSLILAQDERWRRA